MCEKKRRVHYWHTTSPKGNKYILDEIKELSDKEPWDGDPDTEDVEFVFHEVPWEERPDIWEADDVE